MESSEEQVMADVLMKKLNSIKLASYNKLSWFGKVVFKVKSIFGRTEPVYDWNTIVSAMMEMGEQGIGKILHYSEGPMILTGGGTVEEEAPSETEHVVGDNGADVTPEFGFSHKDMATRQLEFLDRRK